MYARSRYHVLLYHGVHGDDVRLGWRNTSGKHVSRARFESHMRHLSAEHTVVRMADIAAAYRGEYDLPDGAVAVTFDDGFLNNYTDAWPVLEQHRVPATFYLATGYIGTGRMIWTDKLETAILGTKLERMAFVLKDREHAYPLTNDDERIAAFQEVKNLCKLLPSGRKDAIVEEVCGELGAETAPDHPLYAFMGWDEVREMDASPLVEFGAHTVDHIALAKVPLKTMKDQVDRSVATLSLELGHPCRFFSYPEGQADDYDGDSIAHLKFRGFDHAPSAIDGINELRNTDPYHIRRIMVGFEGRPYPFADI